MKRHERMVTAKIFTFKIRGPLNAEPRVFPPLPQLLRLVLTDYDGDIDSMTFAKTVS